MKIPQVLNKYWLLFLIIGCCCFFTPATLSFYDHYKKYGLESTLKGIYPAFIFILWTVFSALVVGLAVYLKSRNKK